MATVGKSIKPLRTFQAQPAKATADLWSDTFPIDVLWGIYARQSTMAQVGNESTEMQTDDLRQWLIERRVRRENITLFDADLGKSGTLRIDQRKDLNELVSRIEADKIKAVLVYRISRLFRDMTGIQYNTFASVCAEHNCILATADGMFFNFNNPWHWKMYRYLSEQAAEYLTQQMTTLYEARIRKARRGYYVGFGIKPWGLIVDYDPKSPTFQKLVVYEPHAEIVMEVLERFYSLDFDFSALCRELERRPVLFPEFNKEEVDERNIPKKSRKRVVGGYHISEQGLRMMLTNVTYLGWIVVMGDIISKNNPFRIIPEEKENIFWQSFYTLADYTPDGKVNEMRQKPPRRFYQKHTQPYALLNKKKLASPQGKVFIHLSSGDSWTYQIIPPDYTITRYQLCEIDTTVIDREVSKCFLARLQETHDFDQYLSYVEEETEKQNHKFDIIQRQLSEIAALQEAILDERLDIQQHIKSFATEEERERARREAAPELERLRQRSIGYDTVASELRQQLPIEEEDDTLTTARQFADFQTEVQRLIPVWDEKPMSVRAEFVNLFIEQVVIEFVAPHWVRLDIFWRHPAWEHESMYVYRKRGIRLQWTDEERELVRTYYPTAKREELMQLLPNKTWRGIRGEAERLGVIRPGRIVSNISFILTWEDLEFMRREGISALNTIYLDSSQREKAAYGQRDWLACHR
jgi:hypothetical protein